MDGMEKTKRELKADSMTLSVETCVDWRGRACKANKHGGMTAAIFVLGLSLFSHPSIFMFTNFHIHLKFESAIKELVLHLKWPACKGHMGIIFP